MLSAVHCLGMLPKMQA